MIDGVGIGEGGLMIEVLLLGIVVLCLVFCLLCMWVI